MNKALDRNKVVLGLSGGVDSTTAALLLQEKGYQVTGLYFDISPNNKQGREEAEKAAVQAGIPFLYKNVHELFSSTVIENFCTEYVKGRTPNPCVYCNPTVKFRVLTEAADREGAFYIATGHYARTLHREGEGWMIRMAANEKKDQSYMLYRLSQSVIQRLLLPLSDLEDKEEAREIARRKQMFNADKKDSQEICFIEDGNYAGFIADRGYACKMGSFVDKEGNVLGEHKGLIHYTIGQRKGLGITFGKPVYVTAMDPETGNVTLGDHEDLFSKEVVCANAFFPASNSGRMPDFLEGERVYAKIRYAAKPAPAHISSMEDGRIKAVFEEKQRAATPGQSIVFYREGCIAGGGLIEQTACKIRT